MSDKISASVENRFYLAVGVFCWPSAPAFKSMVATAQALSWPVYLNFFSSVLSAVPMWIELPFELWVALGGGMVDRDGPISDRRSGDEDLR